LLPLHNQNSFSAHKILLITLLLDFNNEI
jgi:hypothetical protein